MIAKYLLALWFSLFFSTVSSALSVKEIVIDGVVSFRREGPKIVIRNQKGEEVFTITNEGVAGTRIDTRDMQLPFVLKIHTKPKVISLYSDDSIAPSHEFLGKLHIKNNRPHAYIDLDGSGFSGVKSLKNVSYSNVFSVDSSFRFRFLGRDTRYSLNDKSKKRVILTGPQITSASPDTSFVRSSTTEEISEVKGKNKKEPVDNLKARIAELEAEIASYKNVMGEATETIKEISDFSDLDAALASLEKTLRKKYLLRPNKNKT